MGKFNTIKKLYSYDKNEERDGEPKRYSPILFNSFNQNPNFENPQKNIINNDELYCPRAIMNKNEAENMVSDTSTPNEKAIERILAAETQMSPKPPANPIDPPP